MCSFYLDSLDPIVEEIIASVEKLSQHPYGCRAVQRMVEHCIEPQRSKILDSIIACQQSLLSHTYGNYVVQKVLAFGRTSDKDAIFRDLITNNNFIMFSKQKQASNVVEAMLRLGDADQRHEIVQAMMNVSLHTKVFSTRGVMLTSATYQCCHLSIQCFIVNQNNETENSVISMAKDPYANYVVNTALKVLERGIQRDELFLLLQSKLDELVSYSQTLQHASKSYISHSVMCVSCLGEDSFCQTDCRYDQDEVIKSLIAATRLLA